MLKRGLMVAALLTALGCYTYAPATIETVPLGASVQGLLATEAQLALRDSLGIGLGPIRGTLLERNGDRVLLAIRSAGTGPGPGAQTLYQRIELAQRDVLRVDVRRLDKTRTALLAVGGLALATVIVVEGFGGGFGGGDDGGGGPPEAPPVFPLRVRLPWP